MGAVVMQYYSPGYEAPSWATSEVREQLMDTADFLLKLMYNGTLKHRLSAGGCGRVGMAVIWNGNVWLT